MGSGCGVKAAGSFRRLCSRRCGRRGAEVRPWGVGRGGARVVVNEGSHGFDGARCLGSCGPALGAKLRDSLRTRRSKTLECDLRERSVGVSEASVFCGGLCKRAVQKLCKCRGTLVLSYKVGQLEALNKLASITLAGKNEAHFGPQKEPTTAESSINHYIARGGADLGNRHTSLPPIPPAPVQQRCTRRAKEEEDDDDEAHADAAVLAQLDADAAELGSRGAGASGRGCSRR